jgi:SOS-response transcriptional repressor LexA
MTRHDGNRREDVLSFIITFREVNGYPPSIRDIAEGTGLAGPSSVFYNLDVLERDGMIVRHRDTKRRARSITVTPKGMGLECDDCGRDDGTHDLQVEH